MPPVAADPLQPAARPLPRPLSRPRKARLALEIMGAYMRARLAMRRRTDLRDALAALRGPSPPLDAPLDAGEQAEAIRLGGAVGKALGGLPVESRCLMRSLVLTRLLVKRDIGSVLVIGVKPGEKFEAHAWIEHEGHPLLPTLGYEPLTVL